MASKTSKRKEPLIITDLTSIILGCPADQIDVQEGDTVEKIFDRSGSADKLAGSKLGIAENWVFVRSDSFNSLTELDNWYRQTLQSLEWLIKHATSGLYSVKSVTLSHGLRYKGVPKSILKCDLEGEPIFRHFDLDDLAHGIVRFANAQPPDSIPTVRLRRDLLEILTEVPLRAVFRRSHHSSFEWNSIFQTVDEPFEHIVEFNMSNHGPDWGVRLKNCVRHLCSFHGALMGLSTASETSKTSIRFAVKAGDVATAEKLKGYKVGLEAIAQRWKVEGGSKNNIELVFDVQPIKEGYIRRRKHHG